MFRCRAITALAAAVVFAVCGWSPVGADEPLRPIPVADFAKDITPFLKKYCQECHVGEKAQAGFDFEKFGTEDAIREGRETWETVVEYLETDLMPPQKKPQPTADEKELVLAWLKNKVLAIDCSGPVKPGRVTIRRLNRDEYRRTIRDLLGVEFDAKEDFPSDDVGYGFDNIGDVLSLPPVLLEKYLAAADTIARRAIVSTDPENAPTKTRKGQVLGSTGEVKLEIQVDRPGKFLFIVRAAADQAGDEPAKMALRLDGKDLTKLDVTNRPDDFENFEFSLDLPEGKHTLGAAFLNDYYKPDDIDPNNRDRNLHVEKLSIRGPIGALPGQLPESHTRLLTCSPGPDADFATCARVILKPFLTRAFRRPARDEEVERLIPLVKLAVDEGDGFERGIQLAVQAVLVSPHFLFRVEQIDGQPTDGVAPLSDYALASRLSYFLWSSLPDDELMRLAEQKALRKELETQVLRMLKDPKAQALVENFAGQWLQLRNLDQLNFDRRRFPEYTDDLKSAMRQETELFFSAMLAEDRNLFDFLTADFTFVNETLAKHYGLKDVTGKEFRRVELSGGERGGLLGQASILAVTSNPTRTSPVKRGKWILENLLASPPPPPPPNIPALKEPGRRERQLVGTLRERMQQHRSDPSCNACHERLDTLGFGLENYSPIGAWRTEDGGSKIDPSGTMPGGKSFATPAELRGILKEQRGDDFRKCLTEKLLTYAIGRGLEVTDRCTIDRMTKAVAQQGDKMSALILEVVRSEPFQMTAR